MQRIFEKSHYALLLAVVFTLPFNLGDIKLNSLLIILLVINSFLLLFFPTKQVKGRFTTVFILFISVYLIHVVGLLLTDNFRVATFELQKKVSILLFPIILLLSPTLTADKVKNILGTFVLSCVLTTIFCLAVASYHFFTSNDLSYFFYHNFSRSVDMHATYLSMYYCFSLVIIAYLYFTRHTKWSRREMILGNSSIIILCLGIFLLGVRTQLFILLLGAIVFFIAYFYKRIGMVRTLFGALLVGFIVVMMIFSFPANRERFKEAINYNNQYALDRKWGEAQVRYLIWSSALDLIKTHPIIGVGTGDVQDELQSYYFSKNYSSLTYLQETKYNAHNQFMETAIGLGILGVLVLISSMLVALINAWKAKNKLYAAFILLFIMSCLTESLLERQNGIVFFAFFNSFLYFFPVNKSEEQSK